MSQQPREAEQARVPASARDFGDFVGIILAEWEESRSDHHLFTDDDGDADRGEPVFVDHEVQGHPQHGMVEHHPHAG